ncbi:YrdB family protein [Lysinibacter sp. HNR]|uniref:YrdB family protein n=1 Tax=Lysinibacter sp. HNR TaxID=3031408 RepID=UPI002434CC56|nr:YrdB family protein [Lysinibacter sp. HNR]WGD38023.1 YrdB family protein [Lysinibacter sp. HNR]
MTQNATSTIDAVTIVRAIVHLALFVSIAAWGFLAWPLPWPGVAAGIGSILIAVLMWACFLSPRPILAVDVFAQGLVELLLIAAAVVGLIHIGAPIIIPLCIGVVAAVVGLIAGRRALS